MAFLNGESSQLYFEKLNDISPNQNSFKKMFKDLPDDMVNLIHDSLTINPNKRKSAAELLKNPIFDSIRVASIEKEPNYLLEVVVDAFYVDPKTGKKEDSSTDDYMKILLDEISKVKCSKLCEKLKFIKIK